MTSRAGSLARLLFLDLLGSVVWFPVWWYSTGLVRVLRAAHRNLEFRSREYGFAIWLRNFFVPMYGQADWVGRLVSVFMRFVVLVGRLIAYLIEAALWGIAVVVWILAPAAFAFLLATNLIAGAATALA